MSCDLDISSEVKDLVAKIILDNGFRISSNVKYSEGSQRGDGYATKTLAAKVVDGEKVLDIFLKCALEFKENRARMEAIYEREIFFYKTMYPTYQQFLADRNVNDGFSSVPKSYGLCDKQFKCIIALENLRVKGFTLFDRTKKYMNDKHFELIFRAFAKFHAISFAMKDQNRECHDGFCDQCPNAYQVCKSLGFEKTLAQSTAQFISKLNPDEDQDIIERCQDLPSKIADHAVNISDYLSEYSILTKGDCWVNNMMILYKDAAEEDPIDVALVDWQCVTGASPVHDIEGLFYSVASKKTMDNYKHYLRIYHDELDRRIRELGSDPDILYPYSIFEKEWREYGPYSFGLAVTCMKVLLCEREEIPDLANTVDTDGAEDFLTGIKGNEEEWMMRVKHIARHLIEIGAVL